MFPAINYHKNGGEMQNENGADRHFRDLRVTVFFLSVIVLSGAAVYSNSFDVPFQFDDKILVSENPLIKDLNYFVDFAAAKEQPEYGLFRRRTLSFLTFALNWRLHGDEVAGYHAFNVLIHILNALLVYGLVIATFKTPYFRDVQPFRYVRLTAFAAGLLFAIHPVQTEAVTYIMQRFTSLAAFFYLLSFILYIHWRLRGERLGYFSPGALPLYFLSLGAAFLAMNTKENTLTIPFAILLYEFLFFRGSLWKRGAAVFPAFMLLALFPLSLLDTGLPVPGYSPGIYIRQSAYDLDYISPPVSTREYFFTQPRVMLTYLRLLVLPVNQNLDYDYPVFGSPFLPPVVLSAFFMALLLSLAFYFYHRSGKAVSWLRLSAFGIFWFFLTISVEASIIPIPMIIAEYRLYLPSMGLFLAFLSAGRMLVDRFDRMRAALIAALVAMVMAFSAATYARNEIWDSELSLWQDVVEKSPLKARGHYNLCRVYESSGACGSALEHCKKALKLRPDYADAHNNAALALECSGQVQQAIEHYGIALSLKPSNEVFHNNLSIAYAAAGRIDDAIEHCRLALALKPDYTEANFNLGLCCLEKGALDDARRAFENTLKLDPSHQGAKKFLAFASREHPIDARNRPR